MSGERVEGQNHEQGGTQQQAPPSPASGRRLCRALTGPRVIHKVGLNQGTDGGGGGEGGLLVILEGSFNLREDRRILARISPPSRQCRIPQLALDAGGDVA